MDTITVSSILLLFQQQGGGAGSLISGFLPLILIFGVFYLLLIRPQQKRQRQVQLEREALLSALKPGDRVVTSSGIYGTIVTVKEKADTVILKVAQSVQLEIQRGSIASIQPEEGKEAEAPK